MRICIQFSWPEDADLIWLRAVTGRRFPCVIRDCVTAWADGLSFAIDTPLEVPASTPVPHESVKTIIFIEDDSTAGRKLSKADGKPALIRNLLRGGAGGMFRMYADAIWEKSSEPLSVDVKISKKYADSFVSSVFRSPGDYERSLYLAVSSYVNGTAFDRDPSPPDDRPIMPPYVTVRFDRERDAKILEMLSGIPEPLRGCFLRNILHVAVMEAETEAEDRTTVVINGEASEEEGGKRHIVRRRRSVSGNPVADTAKNRDTQEARSDAGMETGTDRVRTAGETASETAQAVPVAETRAKPAPTPGTAPETGTAKNRGQVETEPRIRTETGADTEVRAGTGSESPEENSMSSGKPDYSAVEENGVSDEPEEGGDALFDLLDGLMGS